MRKLILVGCLSYLLVGLTQVAPGAMLSELLEHYGKSYTAGGMLLFLQFTGFMAGVLTAPWWGRLLGKRRAITSGLLLLGLGEILISLLPSWPLLVACAAAAGYGFGLIETMVGSLVMDVVRERKEIIFTRMEVFFGLGALLIPLITAGMIAWGPWPLSFGLLGLLSLGTALLWALMSFDEIDPFLRVLSRAAKAAEQPARYVKNHLPLLGVFVLIFFLYVGIEMSIYNFLPSFMVETLGVDSAQASVSVSVYWGAMVVGRLVAGYIAARSGQFRYLAWSTAAAIGLLGGFAVLPVGWWGGLAFVFGLGFAMSGFFAIGLIFANEAFPGMTERTTSLLIAGGGIGGSLLPLWTGRNMDTLTPSAAYLVLTAAMAVMLALLVLARSKAARLGTADGTKAAGLEV